MGLDYGHTCPAIDKDISEIQDNIKSYFEELIKEVCPLADKEKTERLANDNAMNLYSDIERLIEDVRKTNMDMRSSADKQINDLDRENDDLRSEVKSLERQVEKLEDKISDLEGANADLEREVKELNALSV